jgi:WD40 repeat protein
VGKEAFKPRPTALTISSDGKYVAALWQGNVFLWAGQADQPPTQLPLPKRPGAAQRAEAVGFATGASTLLAVTDDGSVAACDVSKQPAAGFQMSGTKLTGRRKTQPFAAPGPLFAAAANLVVDGSSEGSLRFLDTATGRELQKLVVVTSALESLACSGDGRRLAGVVSDEKRRPTLMVWSIPEGRQLAAFPVQRSGLLAVDPTGAFVALATDRDVELWEIATGKRAQAIPADGVNLRALAFLPDGKLAGAGASQVICLWDTKTGKPVPGSGDHSAAISDVAWAPDGTAVTASLDGSICSWDIGKSIPLRRLIAHEGGVSAIVLARDGKTLFSTGLYDQTIRAWDLTTGVKTFELNDEQSAPHPAMTLSPDGKTLAAGRVTGPIELWDVPTRKPLRVLKGSGAPTCALRFNSAGRLVSRDRSGALVCWNVEKGTEVWRSDGGRTDAGPLLLTPGEKQVMSPLAGDGAGPGQAMILGFWDVDKGELRQRVEIGPGEITALAHGVDNKSILVGTADGKLIRWDAEKRKVVTTHTGHRGIVTAISVSPRGEVISGGTDTTAILWPGHR